MKSKTGQNIVLTVIGGVGYGFLASGSEFESDSEAVKSEKIKTPYGDVSISFFSTGCFDIAFISRHQGKKHVPPHKVNYSALVAAAQNIGAPVLSVNSVGLMRSVPLTVNCETEEPLKSESQVTPDSFSIFPLFIPNDFIDMTKNRVCTFYDEETVHADMSDPYCMDIRKQLFSVLKNQNQSYSEGVYLCTEGSRFETKAEIRMYAQFADVVGMTGVPEVVLAKEAGLCYASLCILTNPAAGLSQGNIVTADEVKVCADQNQKVVFSIISKLAEKLNQRNTEKIEKRCFCKEATESGKL